jgi:hypothetical protein
MQTDKWWARMLRQRTDRDHKRQVRASGGHHQEKLLVEFKPEGARFATIEFKGAGCPPATPVEGSIAAEVLTDPNNGSLGRSG